MSLGSGKLRNLGRGFAVVCLGVSAMTVCADDFILSSGKTVSGAIVSESDTEYVIQTSIGNIKVAKTDVVRRVDLGTSPLEIEGDVALGRGDLERARLNYQQALAGAEADSAAAQRLQGKIDELSSATRQQAESSLITRFNQATALINAGNYDRAAVVLGELESRAATDDTLTSRVNQMQARVHYGRGLAALDAVNLPLAQEQLEAAIAVDPTFYPAYLSLGDSLLGNSATVGRGLELLERGLDVGGEAISEQQRYSYLYKLAGKYFEQRDYVNAAATYAALIPAREQYPIYEDALDRAVESYVRMGEENLSSDFRETIQNLNHALRLNPQNEKAHFLLGRIYQDIGQIENSVVTLQRLTTLSPTYPEAHYYLGRAYLQMGNYDKAVEHLSLEISNRSNNYEALVDRAEAHIELGNFPAAQTDLNAAKGIDESRWMAYYLTGLLEFRENDYEGARQALMEALDRNRSAMPAHLLMARVLVAENQVDGARTWLEQVVESLQAVQQPGYRYRSYLADGLTQLGEISIQQNSPRQAENYLTRALEVLPRYQPALVAMADTKLQLASDAFVSDSREKLYDEAEALYLQAIAADGEDTDLLLKVGTFYRMYASDSAKAQQYYNLYVDKGGRDPRVNGWLTSVGGSPRPEIAAPVVVADVSTTGTAATTGTLAAAVATTGTPTGGFVLPADAVMAQTTGTEEAALLTTGAMVAAPPTQPIPAQPIPGQPIPGQVMPAQPMPGQPIPGQVTPPAAPPAETGAVMPPAPQ